MISCPKCGAPCLDAHHFCPACGADLSNTASSSDKETLIGTTIARKFVLRELIGSGGMGKVFRADQKGVGRTVAVKIMHRHLLGDETAAARFTNEARAASSLNHPHSIAVLDFGQTAVGMLYIVMEYLRGRSLDGLLRTQFPLDPGRVVRLFCQALDAVEAAHNQSIIHRDLKPENIFLLDNHARDFVKVLDFGIAKMLDNEDRSVTTPGLVPGTPEYMSPEQARGEKLDPRSDIYSMGVILYELLTGTVPFRGNSAVATMMSHVQDPVPPPTQRRPELAIPAALESIVLWALAKDADERISSSGQFRDVLQAWAKVANIEDEQDDQGPEIEINSEHIAEISGFEPELSEEIAVPSERLKTIAEGLAGREHDFDHISNFIDTKGARSYVLLGAKGIGKRRLLNAARAYAKARGYQVIRVKPAFGWNPEPVQVAHEIALECLKLKQKENADIIARVKEKGLDQDSVPGIEEFFHLPTALSQVDAASRKRERGAAFRQLLYQHATENKVVFIIDEIDRCDRPSQEMLISLLNAPQNEMAVIASTTDDLSEQLSENVIQHTLKPLDNDQSQEMCLRLFGAKVPSEIIEKIAESGKGNPLFIEQLAFAATHEGIVDPPERLGDLVDARMQRLDKDARDILQWIAAINQPASSSVLKKLIQRDVDESRLEALAAQGLLRPAPRAKKQRSAREFIFTHHMVGMVVYSTIPAEVRREMHQRIASYLRQNNASFTAIAFHAYEGDDGPQAVEELDRAGAWSTRCLDSKSAIVNYTNALDLVRREWGRGRVSASDLDKTAVDLALRLAEVLKQNNDALTAEGVIGEALSVAAGHDSVRAELRLALGRLDIDRGNFQRAIRHLQLAQLDASAADSPYLIGETSRELARAHGLNGEKDEASKLLFDALDKSVEASGQPMASWQVLLEAANICLQIDYPSRAQGYLLDALQQAEKDNSVYGKLQVIRKMAALHQTNSEWNEAEVRINQGIELCILLGDRTQRIELHLSLGRMRRIAGEVEEARKHIDAAMLLCTELKWIEGIELVKQESEMLRFALPQSL